MQTLGFGADLDGIRTNFKEMKEINNLSFKTESTFTTCTFCQKIGGRRVMKNHTIVQLHRVPHLQHSHKVTYTFLKTL